jgi:transposase
MHPPLVLRPLTDTERTRLRAGLRSDDAFTLRRCQILLAADQGQDSRLIATNLGCSPGTSRNAIKAFHARGLDCLKPLSSRPHSAQAFLTHDHAQALEELLHQSPRFHGQPTSLWTLDRVAQVCCQRGWTPRVLSGEAVRQALKRLGISWQRAKHWITSPDPAYARKKKRATG